ncbi:unnamed protein product [Tenebrio molitor]|nr:unnamed protein product [Tenebrio molitor]
MTSELTNEEINQQWNDYKIKYKRDYSRHVTKGGPGVAQAPPKIIVPPRVPLQILGPIQYIIVR